MNGEHLRSDNRQAAYTCPMHPEIRQSTPGMCPECGMALVKDSAAPRGQRDRHEGHSPNIFAKRFWVSLALTVPIVLYSPLPQALLGWSLPMFPGARLVPALLGSIVFFYGGWIFLTSAWRELRGKAPGMMTLISLAIVTAYLYSVVQVLRGIEQTLFWELTSLIVIMLLGHWLEMRAVKGAQGALKELSKLLPDTAEVEQGGTTETITLDELKTGDVIVVRPGGKIAADGEIIEGDSDIDEALATGESKPVQKKVGDAVIAGTINGEGSLRVKVNKIGEETFLAGVMRLVAEAQASKSKLQLLSDKAAFYLTVIAVAAGLLTLFVWLPLRGADFGFTRMVAVLVIACPHALGLAIPLVASISTTMAAQNGFLVRQRLALEAARNIDVVLFDKTGTLTKGEYGVTGVFPGKGRSEAEVLQLAASVDAKSEHSVSKAIVKKAKEGKIGLLPVTRFRRLPGKGVMGVIESKDVRVGGRALWEDSGLALTDSVKGRVQQENKAGKTIVYVLSDRKFAGAVALGDIIRDESREAISQLKRQGVHVAMITGDSEAVAQWVARALGIGEYFAEVLPEHKVDKVKALQRRGKKVAMVGDGINDAPALTQADVGIAIGAGTNVAIESAGIVLVKNDPRDIPKIIQLSRLTYTKMIQNLFWATGYNVVALPLAAGAAAAWGILLNPALAAIFMSLSTVIVAANAVLLRRQPLVNMRGKINSIKRGGFIVIALLVTAVPLAASAASSAEHSRPVSEVIEEIKAAQGVVDQTEVDCQAVSDGQLEELGEAVMQAMAGSSEQHEIMDNMMGGEGSESLRAMHMAMGQRYLGCAQGTFGTMGMTPLRPSGYEGQVGSMMRGLRGGDGFMMGNFYGPWGMGGIGGIGMLLFWGLVLVGVVLLVKWLAGLPGGNKEKPALDILKERYARGEINKEEFEAKKKDLT